jgi:carbon storage regulator CsrA
MEATNMLTLTRKPQERIIIEDEESGILITLVVKEIRRNQVRLGIEAPDKVKIDRAEVYIKRVKEGTP